MDEYFGFVTVRVKSTRLPFKCLLKLSDKTVLENIFNRCLDNKITPILCTTQLSEDDVLEQLAINNNIKFFRGSNNNKLKRWLDCANFFEIERFHTIDADDPYFDPLLVKESMNKLKKSDLDIVRPSTYSSNGAGSVGYSIKRALIEDIMSSLKDNTDTEMIEKFIDFNRFKSEIMQEDIELNYQIRLTLDYEEDYHLLSFISRELGSNPSRKSIINLFKANPDLYKLNFFRNSDWKIKQKNQLK